MKRMIDCDKIHVNNQGKVEIKDAKFTNDVELPVTQSANKIYYHPIYMVDSQAVATDIKFEWCLTILDNQPTAYNSTTIINKLKELLDAGALININGFLKISGTYYTAYFIYKTGGLYKIWAFSASERNNSVDLTTLLNSSVLSINDGVNAIN